MITVVYYTANHENINFEDKIKRNLLKNINGLPLISVSQLPIDFGKNICVGEVGRSSYNQWRQLQIGVSTVKTKFVALAESDFLYTQEHFSFKPEAEDIFYAPLKVYQLCTMKFRLNKFIPMHRRYREGASIVGKDYLLETLDSILGPEMWKTGIEIPSKMLPHLFLDKNISLFRNRIPLVTFRTDAGMHRHIHDDHPTGVDALPFWGDAKSLMKQCGLCR